LAKKVKGKGRFGPRSPYVNTLFFFGGWLCAIQLFPHQLQTQNKQKTNNKIQVAIGWTNICAREAKPSQANPSKTKPMQRKANQNVCVFLLDRSLEYCMGLFCVFGFGLDHDDNRTDESKNRN